MPGFAFILEPVAFAWDLHDVRMVQQPIQHGVRFGLGNRCRPGKRDMNRDGIVCVPNYPPLGVDVLRRSAPSLPSPMLVPIQLLRSAAAAPA
jgi:hypothetical protein